MKKATTIALILSLVLSTGAVTLAEEVKVPFSSIKSSCYREIDMSRAEFALSEVGEECVKEEWLKENQPEPTESELPSDFPIEKLIEKEPNLVDVVRVVDNPSELLEFMNGYFQIGAVEGRSTGPFTAYSPERFLKVGKGECNDWATFAAEVLQKNDYYAKKFTYAKHPMDGGHVIAIWKEDGQYSYLTILGERAKIYWEVGSSIEGVLVSEANRYKIQRDDILTYISYEPSILNNHKALGPVAAKAVLESIPHNESVSKDKLDFTPKKDAPSYKHNFFEGRIIKKEKKSWNKYLITAAVQLEKTFKNPTPKYVLVDFVTNTNTRYTKYLRTKDEEEKINIEKVNPGDMGLIYTKEEVATLSKNKRFTARKIML